MASESISYSFERYLNIRGAHGPSFSHDGQLLSFLTDITGVDEAWSIPVEIHAPHPAWPEQLTFGGERISRVSYSPNEDLLLLAGDVGGSELTQLATLSNDGSVQCALTHRPEVMYRFGGWSPDGQRIVYSSNERDARFFDVYEMELSSGQSKVLMQGEGTFYVVGYAPDGLQVLVEQYVTNIHNQLFLVNCDNGAIRQLTAQPQGDGPALYQSGVWSHDSQYLYLLSNHGRQFLSLAQLDLVSHELTYLEDDLWDTELLTVTHDGTRLAIVKNEDGYSRLSLYDLSQGWQGRQSLSVPDLPHATISELTWSQDGSRLALVAQFANHAPDIGIWDLTEQRFWWATNSSFGGIPPEVLREPSLIRYTSFDQREIPAWLYLPDGGEERNLPFVIYVHGGPESQSRPVLNVVVQYLLGRGYGVLVPNVRGSTGYGYAYQSLDDVRLRMDSVTDLQYAVHWLRTKQLADPRRIAVMGGSYGGFMVLAALTTYPDLWAAGVEIVGIANFVTFLENTSSWRRKLRESEYGNLENDREFLEQISPIRSVDRIAAPLFVVHGANDPRVPVGEAEQIVTALQTRKVPVEYLRFEDEGHGLIKRANRLVAYPAIARFLDEHVLRRL